ncbi:MAG TPA: class I SAM-dependent methyltransferase [Candidatus Bathyarchaeia archaeon]|nr:class I SAM-dependent methyltransferase [Candidatus Bathyarchaeia archaeon]
MPDDFETTQSKHFARADREHFAWQTAGPGFAELESRFLAGALATVGAPLLEIGCGEGGNLFHLVPRDPQAAPREAAGGALPGGDRSPSPPVAAGRPPFVGIDAYLDKLRFAAAAVPRARFACADAARLPFCDGRFATVLIRDVLHHLAQPEATLAEACRVLAPGGSFVLIEPNAHNPLVRLQMAIVPAERGAARSDESWLRGLVRGLPLDRLEVEMAAPLPLARLVLHHRFGLPGLGRSRAVRALLAGCDRLASRLLPPSRWSYVVARAARA